MSEKINELLKGIDTDDGYDAYWDTSTGALYGTEIKRKVNEYVDGLEDEIAKWKRLVEVLRSNATAVEARHEDTVEKLESMIDPQTLKEYKDLLQQKATDEMIRYFLEKEAQE